MATPDPATRALYTRLEEVLGEEHANTLMTRLPIESGTDLATRADLDARFDALEASLDRRFDQVDRRFEEIDRRWESRFDTVDDRLFGLHGALNDHLKTLTVTMVGGMTALTAIYAGLLTIIA